MLALVLAATMSFTAPQYDAARAGACLPDSIPVPCTDLLLCKVYGVRRGQTQPQLFQTIPAAGRQGQIITFTPAPPDHVTDQWSVFITSVDTNGNESCWSNMATLNGTVSVDDPPPTSRLVRDEWFDILGRKLHARPHTPGVYVHRRGTWKKLTVIL